MHKKFKWVIKHLRHTYKIYGCFLCMVLVICHFSSYAGDVKRNTASDVQITQDRNTRPNTNQLQETPQKPSSDKLLKPVPKSDDRSRKKSRSRQPSKARDIKLPGHADLVVKNLRLNKNRCRPGEKVQVFAEIQNQGNQGLRNIKVRFHLNEKRISRDQTISLGAGKGRRVSMTFKAPVRGNHQILAMVDPDNRVPEANERNNSKTAELKVQSSERKGSKKQRIEKKQKRVLKKDDRPKAETFVDLEIVDLTLSPQEVSPGQKVTITARVRNKSRNKAGKVAIRFKLEEKNITRDQIITLSSSRPVKVKATFKPKKAGDHSVFAILDPDQKHPDPNRKNNFKNMVLKVSALDSDRTEIKDMIPVKAGITFLSPSGGTYFKGGVIFIQWDPYGLPTTTQYYMGLKYASSGSQTVNITIPKPKPGGPTMKSPGFYWDIPQTLMEGPYRLTVSTSDNLYSVTSKPFMIASGGIEILSPNSNSIWAIPGTYYIQWQTDTSKWKDPKSQGQLFEKSKAAQIELIRVDPGVFSPAIKLGDIADFRGKPHTPFKWDIPVWLNHGNYRIRVISNDKKFFGLSDSIKLGPQCKKNCNNFLIKTPSKGSHWMHNSKMNIHWIINPNTTSLIPTYGIAIKKVNISLLSSDGSFLKYIKKDVVSKHGVKKEFLWPVPTFYNKVLDGEYKIEVKTVDGIHYGRSEKFSISSTKQWISDQPLIKVANPGTNSTWPGKSKNMKIAWARAGKMNSKVNIIIYRPKEHLAKIKKGYITIAKNIPNNGVHVPGVPASSLHPCGEGPYRVRVETIDHKVSDDSGIFYIGNNPAIKIKSPGVLNLWNTNTTEIIEWTMNYNWCHDGVFDIYLLYNYKNKKPYGSKYMPAPKSEAVWIKKNFKPKLSKGVYSLVYPVPQKTYPGYYDLIVESSEYPQMSGRTRVEVKQSISPVPQFDLKAEKPKSFYPPKPEKPDFEIVQHKAYHKGLYIDKIGIKVHNRGAGYSGELGISVTASPTKGTDQSPKTAKLAPAKLGKITEHIKYPGYIVNFKPNEKKVFELKLTSNILFKSKDAYNIPKLGPFNARIYVYPVDTKVHMPSNSLSIDICMTELEYIKGDAYFELNSGNSWNKVFLDEKDFSVKKDKLKWSQNNKSFEAQFKTKVFNFGCTVALVQGNLWVIGQEKYKQSLGAFTLLPGEGKHVFKKVKVYIPKYGYKASGTKIKYSFSSKHILETYSTKIKIIN